MRIFGLKNILSFCLLCGSTLFLFLCPSLSFSAEGLYHSETEFEIKKSGDKFSLSAKRKVLETPLTRAGTLEEARSFYDKFYAKISKFKAKRNGKKLKNAVTSRIPKYRDMFFNEGAMHTLSFPTNTAIGDTFEYSFNTKYTSAEYFPLTYIPNIDSLVRYEILIKHPSSVTIEFNFFFPRDSIPIHVSRVDNRRTRLVILNTPYREHLPLFDHNGYHVMVVTSVFHEDQPITPTSVDYFSEWYGAQTPLSPTLDSALAEELSLALGAETEPLEQVRTIYDFVRTNIRYTAEVNPEHSILPHAPYDVLSRRYGDCKDRACLVSAIANEFDIPINMALINTNHSVPVESVHIGFFNHMICAYETDNGFIVFDPTASHTTFDRLPERLVDRHMLVLDDDNPEYIQATSAGQRPTVELTVSGSLDSLSSTKALIRFSGDYSSLFSRAAEELTVHRRKEILDALLSERFSAIGFSDYSYVTVEDDSAIVQATANLKKAVVISPSGKTYLKQYPLRWLESEIVQRADDSLPIHLSGRPIYEFSMTLTMAPYESGPDSVVIDNPMGFYHASYLSSADSILSFSCKLDWSEKTLNSSARNELVSFARELYNIKNKMFVIQEKD